MANILVVDDERAICEAFSMMLKREGHSPEIAASGQEALRKIEAQPPDAVFLDIQMPGSSGLEVLEQIHAMQPQLPVILMTAYGTLDTAIRAQKLKAFDYLGKPVDLERVRKVLRRALHVPSESKSLPHRQDANAVMIGSSAAMQEIFKKISLLTTNDLTVSIYGESGAGKEVAARVIHAHSDRADKPFVAVNCAAIPEPLMESELFGQERGAFAEAHEQRQGRFEAARDGTLFLDEISELPLKLQSKLLRVVQERNFERIGSLTLIPFRARLIVASNRNLREEVAAGRFRDDLYHRLGLVSLDIPPLRERQEDIEALAMHILARANVEIGKEVRGIESAALARLVAYDWPGNVRQLEHAIKRAVLVAQGPSIAEHDLELSNTSTAKQPVERLSAAVRDALNTMLASGAAEGEDASVFQEIINMAELELVNEALRITNGNQVSASRLLGISRTTLRKRIDN
jgi:DNA-binding NtrC family response regulator